MEPAQAAVHAHEQVVTPWDVQGSVSNDGKQSAIDYDKLIEQFGTRRIDEALLEKFERVTGHRPHPFLRRGLFFSHRWVDFRLSLCVLYDRPCLWVESWIESWIGMRRANPSSCILVVVRVVIVCIWDI
jgi:hypothetical protein